MLFYFPPTPAQHFFAEHVQQQGLLCNHPADADFLLLPFMYEVIYNLKPVKLQALGLQQEDLHRLRIIAEQLDFLSVTTSKPLIVFFYRDPVVPLPFRNALVFRTSAYAQLAGNKTFGLPAFLSSRGTDATFVPVQKPATPIVSFRGKSAPIQLSKQVWVREQANRLLQHFHLPLKVKNFEPDGYLLRRRAVLSCMRKKTALETDFVLNPAGDGSQYRESYIQSFNRAHYMITAAGFGNYAYRLYEIMRAGRIPVFIDSDVLLPCADVINWKQLMVWVPAADVDRTADYILAFHHAIHPDDFLQLQQHLQDIYVQYCTQQGFSHYLMEFLEKSLQ